MEDLIIWLIAWIGFDLWLALSLGWVAAIYKPITGRLWTTCGQFPYRPNWPVWLDCPGPSDLPVRGDFGAWLFCQDGPTRTPGPAKITIPLQRSIAIRKSHFSLQKIETKNTGPNNTTKTSRRGASALQGVPKGTPGRAFCYHFQDFAAHLC